MGIINDIRKQPPHIREIFMWLMVIIVFSVIGYFGIRSTGSRFVAMINPESAEQDSNSAIAQKKSKSPFELLSESMGTLTAGIVGLFERGDDATVNIINKTEAMPPRLFPTQE